MKESIALTFGLAAWILSGAPGVAQGFAEYETLLSGCGSQGGRELVIQTLWEDPNCFQASAAIKTYLPGTLVFDIEYETQANQQATGLLVSTASGLGSFSFSHTGGGPWCPNAPCHGSFPDVQIAIGPDDVVSFELSAFPFFSAGTRCVFKNLVFTPAAGIHDLGHALGPALRYEHVPSPSAGSSFFNLAGLGDVDGDGLGDFAYGARGLSGTGNDGNVIVVSGTSGVLLHEIPGTPGSGFQLGAAVARAGDLDGDGRADFFASQPGWPNQFAALGRVIAYSGQTGGVLWTVEGTQLDGAFAHSIDSAGDVDDDGVGDLIVGATSMDGVSSNQGAALVFSGATRALLHAIPGLFFDERFGQAVSGAGDVDGDGHDDFVATSTSYPGPASLNGIARVYSGQTGALLHAFVGLPQEQLGWAVDEAGDFDGDGFGDVIVSAALGAEVSRVYSGRTGGILLEEPGGRDVAGVGDVDGNGFDDVAIGTGSAISGATVARVHGGPAGALLFETGSDQHVGFGAAVDGGHDTDGDGSLDLFVLARRQFDRRTVFLVQTADPAKQTIPTLTGTGSLAPYSHTRVEIHGGSPCAPVTMVIGSEILAFPVAFGLLVPSIDALAFFALDGSGSFSADWRWPPNIPSHTTFLLQAWILEPVSVRGLTATNAIALTAP